MLPTAAVGAGRAYRLYLDVYRLRPSPAVRVMTIPLPAAANASAGQRACTLSVGTGAGGGWAASADGLPSLSADGRVGMVPCWDVPAGGGIDPAAASKTLARVFWTASAGGTSSVATAGRGAATVSLAVDSSLGGELAPGLRAGANNGWRQVASVDGTTGFWAAAVGATGSGVSYIVPSSTEAARPEGSWAVTRVFTVRGGAGSLDARSVGFSANGRLVAASSPLDKGYDGLFYLGASAAERPTTAGSPAAASFALPGIRSLSPWAFAFDGLTRVWVAVDNSPRGKGTLLQFTFGGSAPQAPASTTWAFSASVTLSSTAPVYSLAGRPEFGRYVLYATDAKRVYRVDTAAALDGDGGSGGGGSGVEVVAVAGPLEAYRGVMRLPARDVSPTPTGSAQPAAGTASATASRSRSRSRSAAATRSRTPPVASRSRSGSLPPPSRSASATRTASASTSPTASASLAASASWSSSASATGSDSASASASPSLTAVPSSSSELTASSSASGTPPSRSRSPPPRPSSGSGTPSATAAASRTRTRSRTPAATPSRSRSSVPPAPEE